MEWPGLENMRSLSGLREDMILKTWA